MIGQSISRYTVESKLGEGGMGEVYKARDTVLQRIVAIKLLPEEMIADPDRRQRLVREAKAASALSHPNIMTVFDVGFDAGRDFIVMEYLEGRTLDRMIPANGLTATQALVFSIRITDALAAAHRAGIIHRDVKPSNVMITDAGTVKVLDFGLAKLAEASGPEAVTRTISVTAQGTTMGTPAYMSPEQAEGRAVDARSDIFSFGSVLYEMVTGRRAFEASSAASALGKIINHDPLPPSSLAGATPPDLDRVIMRCLRKDPDRRYQTMADLKVALEDLVSDISSNAVPVGRARASRILWPAIAVAGLAVLTAAIYTLGQRSRSSDDAARMTALPLTSLPGEVRYPALSPEGDRVAFSWNGASGDNVDIYVQQVGAGSPLRLTTDAAADSTPAWSPDGRAIAFVRRIGSAARYELRTVPPLGGTERIVAEIAPTRSVYQPLAATWCPDSSCLIVTDGQGVGKPDALFVIDVDGSNKHQVTFPAADHWGDTDPAVSPDGRWLTFRRAVTPFTANMYRVPLGPRAAAAGDPVLLTDFKFNGNRPAWMPDSRTIVLSAKNNLWRMNAVDGGEPIRLPFVGQDGSQPAISRPQNGPPRLVYMRMFRDTNIWTVETAAPGAPSLPKRTSVNSTRSDHLPALSPDGSRVAFFSSRSGEFELWVADRDGANAMQLTTLKSLPGFPRWSPDGRTLAFHSDPEGHPDVMAIAVAGGRPRIVTAGPLSGGYPSFARDGQSIYFSGPGPQGQLRIWKMPVIGGMPTQVTDTPGDVPVESYDGRTLFYVETAPRPSALWRLPLAGGPPTKLVDGVVNGAFDVAETGVYFIDQVSTALPVAPFDNRATDTRLRFYEFATDRAMTVVDNLGPLALGLSTSRDGRTILIARTDAAADELMVVENFR